MNQSYIALGFTLEIKKDIDELQEATKEERNEERSEGIGMEKEWGYTGGVEGRGCKRGRDNYSHNTKYGYI